MGCGRAVPEGQAGGCRLVPAAAPSPREQSAEPGACGESSGLALRGGSGRGDRPGAETAAVPVLGWLCPNPAGMARYRGVREAIPGALAVYSMKTVVSLLTL